MTSRETFTPHVQDDIRQYTIAELVASSASGESQGLHDKVNDIVDGDEPLEALSTMGYDMPFSHRMRVLWQ